MYHCRCTATFIPKYCNTFKAGSSIYHKACTSFYLLIWSILTKLNTLSFKSVKLSSRVRKRTELHKFSPLFCFTAAVRKIESLRCWEMLDCKAFNWNLNRCFLYYNMHRWMKIIPQIRKTLSLHSLNKWAHQS